MTVAVTPSALRYESGGETWYFCGPGCREAFVDRREREDEGEGA